MVKLARMQLVSPENSRAAAADASRQEPALQAERNANRLDDALSSIGSRFTAGYPERMSELDIALCAFIDDLRESGAGPASTPYATTNEEHKKDK